MKPEDYDYLIDFLASRHDKVRTKRQQLEIREGIAGLVMLRATADHGQRPTGDIDSSP